MSHGVQENRHGNLCWELCWAQKAVCLSVCPSGHAVLFCHSRGKKKTQRNCLLFFPVEIFPALPASPSQ